MLSEATIITLRAIWIMFRTITPYAIIVLAIGTVAYAILKHHNFKFNNIFK